MTDGGLLPLLPNAEFPVSRGRFDPSLIRECSSYSENSAVVIQINSENRTADELI